MKPIDNKPVITPVGFKQELARRWEEFVDCAFRSSTMVPFLVRALRLHASSRVIDLAAGTGCDMVSLYNRGIASCGNEIDAGLRRVAQEAFEQRGWYPQLVRCDWCELSSAFEAGAFDAGFIVGNSFCLVRDQMAHSTAAREIRGILPRGGRLVVDERNFEYILRSRKEILEGGDFRYSRRVVYCGQKIEGRPVAISDDEVVFAYFDHSTGREIGRLSMHPFKTDELRLGGENNAGLTAIQVEYKLVDVKNGGGSYKGNS